MSIHNTLCKAIWSLILFLAAAAALRRTAFVLQRDCLRDHKVSMTLQTQVARPQLAATRGLSWTDSKPERRLVCQRTRKLLTKQQKEPETPGRVTLDHRSDPRQPVGPLWGLRPRRRTTFPLTCSTSPLNCKWINRAADTERTRRRETEGH